jgi:hypothetical protein
VFVGKPQAFLALPLKDTDSFDLAKQIREVLESQGIESVLATDFGTEGPSRIRSRPSAKPKSS